MKKPTKCIACEADALSDAAVCGFHLNHASHEIATDTPFLKELRQMFMDAKYDRENPNQLAERAYYLHGKLSMQKSLEWRIEQWRRAKKYMLNDVWQPIFDELCALEAADLVEQDKLTGEHSTEAGASS